MSALASENRLPTSQWIYYDSAMEHGSEDPSNPEQTTRVMTVMLASEY